MHSRILNNLVPFSLKNRTSCYVLYDNHPRDNKKIDVIVYTKIGEVIEYFQRRLLLSISIGVNQKDDKAAQIRILRNGELELFYLVFDAADLTILSRGDELRVIHKLTNVSKYTISDDSCSGKPSLQVFLKNNTMLILDENFENFKSPTLSPILMSEFDPPTDSLNNEAMPVVRYLRRKLTEAKYTVNCNEKSYKEFLEIRQRAAFSMYKKMNPNCDLEFVTGSQEFPIAVLQIVPCQPQIRVCNMKIVIIYPILNKNTEILENVHILLHGGTSKSIEFTTKIFEESAAPPFWIEAKSQILKPNTQSQIVAVIDYDEIKLNLTSTIEFDGAIFYKKCGVESVVPLHDVKLSSLDTMGKQFDVMSSDPMDEMTILAVLASAEKTDLILRQINSEACEIMDVDMFCTYLKMQRIPNTENMAIHRGSPYHVLNGVMIILNNKIRSVDQLEVTAYTRSPSHVLALIHHIHDVVRSPIVITTPAYNVTATNNTLAVGTTTAGDNEPDYNYANYATSMLNRTQLVLEYLDSCMIHMSESKKSAVQSENAIQIDLFAQGVERFIEFKEKMQEEAAKGAKMLNETPETVIVPEEMSMDW